MICHKKKIKYTRTTTKTQPIKQQQQQKSTFILGNHRGCKLLILFIPSAVCLSCRRGPCCSSNGMWLFMISIKSKQPPWEKRQDLTKLLLCSVTQSITRPLPHKAAVQILPANVLHVLQAWLPQRQCLINSQSFIYAGVLYYYRSPPNRLSFCTGLTQGNIFWNIFSRKYVAHTVISTSKPESTFQNVLIHPFNFTHVLILAHRPLHDADLLTCELINSWVFSPLTKAEKMLLWVSSMVFCHNRVIVCCCACGGLIQVTAEVQWCLGGKKIIQISYWICV